MRFPAFGAIVPDRAGRFWVSEYERPSAAAVTWYVMTESAELLGKVMLPRDVRVLDITDRNVLVQVRDADGAVGVRIYRLAPP